VSRLRARCPDCRTLTAVALGAEYQCHSCGREFGAGLVRVPRAWGVGGEAMAEAAWLDLPYPETGVVEADSVLDQAAALAADLPDRPLVLGGCCCAHVGAVSGLAARHGRLGLVWLDAHGDLNTPATSPSGNEWGMPLRMLLDAGTVDPDHVVHVGARNLDPPEEAYIEAIALPVGVEALRTVLERVEVVYVALDADVLAPGAVDVFMPEAGGPSLQELEELLTRIAARATVVGAGVTGLRPGEGNVEPVSRLLRALSL
jgi:arginase family enzyme